jgi:hypothetical protein
MKKINKQDCLKNGFSRVTVLIGRCARLSAVQYESVESCKLPTVARSLLLVVICTLTFLATGANSMAQSALAASPSKSALQFSLATAGYQFDIVQYKNSTNLLVDSPIASVPSTAGSSSGPLGFGAVFTVKNGTRMPINVAFPWAYWATNKIVFTVYDTNDTVVWTSTPIPVDVPPLAVPVNLQLKSGQSWSQAVFVPLFTGNGLTAQNLLPDGNYRLEAAVAGTPALSVNTGFVVRNFHLLSL